MTQEDETMTYRQRLMRDHPENVGRYHTGGALGCPCDYGYEKNPACQERKQKAMTCRECWEREVKA